MATSATTEISEITTDNGNLPQGPANPIATPMIMGLLSGLGLDLTWQDQNTENS